MSYYKSYSQVESPDCIIVADAHFAIIFVGVWNHPHKPLQTLATI
jgi:hypothetical protein